MKYIIKQCLICNKQYRAYSSNRKTCSKKCQKIYFRKTNEILYQDNYYTILDISTKKFPNATTLIDTNNCTPNLLNNGRWYLSKGKIKNYVRRGSNKNNTIKLHQFILKKIIKKDIDHKNEDTTDNRKNNLRTCKHSENGMNRGKQTNNTSGYKGVSWKIKNNAWQSFIIKNQKQIYLGLFNCKHKAAEAYNKAALIFHSEFAKLNIIKNA